MFVFPVAEQRQAGHCAVGAARRANDKVEQLMMLASHVTRCNQAGSLAGCQADIADAKLLELYVRELIGQPSTGVWLMLYREGYDRFTRVRMSDSATDSTNSSCLGFCADGVIAWGEHAVWKEYPRLAVALTQHPHVRKEIWYLQKYYWFHSALGVWLRNYGVCYPRLKYLWRLETDVLWTGTIDQLVSLAGNDHADVLLPTTYGENRTRLARRCAICKAARMPNLCLARSTLHFALSVITILSTRRFWRTCNQRSTSSRSSV